MEKLDGKNEDLVAANIAQLKEIFPEVFAEGKINFDRLQELLGNYVATDENHYNFTWHGKREAGRLAQTPTMGTLRPCPNESVEWEKTQNLFIEGDNLEVLKLLRNSYHRQIKMIYIDPPYNTGNDFVYEDDFKDGVKNYLEVTGQLDSEGMKVSTNSSSAGRYHTNWLNMMYPRLKIARNLLRDDGVIFISIDDNEIGNLKKLCDEIFGEENFIDIFSWQKTTTPPNLSKKTKKSCEYIIAYQKLNCGQLKGLVKNSNSANGLMNQTNPVGTLVFPARITNTKLLDGIYPAGEYGTSSYAISLLEDTEAKNGVFIKPVKLKGKFKWSQKYLDESIQNGVKIYIQTKAFSPSYEKEEYEPEKPWNIINGSFGVGTNENASDELDDLFQKNFSENLYPKPTSLIEYLINTCVVSDDIVMDFFAGSGTTGHAILKLNQQDNGKRKFICVQLPEATDKESNARKAGFKIISDISKERIRRAGKKIREESPLFSGDLGFKVFKLDTSNIKRWEAGFDTLKDDLLNAVDYIKHDRSNDDVLYELLLKYGLPLSMQIETRIIAGKLVYSIGFGALVVCLENDVCIEVAKGIGALKEELNPEIMRVVFKDSGFKNDVVKTNALQTLKHFAIEDIKSL